MTKRIFRDGKLREGWVEFLRQFSFHHLAHLTFKFAKCSIDLAFLRLRHWANGLCRISQGPIEWVAFPEPTHDELYHLHALIWGTFTVPIKMMEDRWQLRNGLYVRIDPFETDRGAEYYITKWVSADFSEGRFSPGLMRAAVRPGRIARMRTSPAKVRILPALCFV